MGKSERWLLQFAFPSESKQEIPINVKAFNKIICLPETKFYAAIISFVV